MQRSSLQHTLSKKRSRARFDNVCRRLLHSALLQLCGGCYVHACFHGGGVRGGVPVAAPARAHLNPASSLAAACGLPRPPPWGTTPFPSPHAPPARIPPPSRGAGATSTRLCAPARSTGAATCRALPASWTARAWRWAGRHFGPRAGDREWLISRGQPRPWPAPRHHTAVPAAPAPSPAPAHTGRDHLRQGVLGALPRAERVGEDAEAD